jgi:hypothetical protein
MENLIEKITSNMLLLEFEYERMSLSGQKCYDEIMEDLTKLQKQVN